MAEVVEANVRGPGASNMWWWMEGFEHSLQESEHLLFRFQLFCKSLRDRIQRALLQLFTCGGTFDSGGLCSSLLLFWSLVRLWRSRLFRDLIALAMLLCVVSTLFDELGNLWLEVLALDFVHTVLADETSHEVLGLTKICCPFHLQVCHLSLLFEDHEQAFRITVFLDLEL